MKGARRSLAIPLSLVLAVILGGCQTTSNLAKPAATPAPEADNPLVLNSAPGAPAAPAATADARPPAPVNAAPAAVVAEPVPAPAPVVAAPSPAAEPIPVAAMPPPSPEPLPTAAPVPARTADGYPNINAPPKEPGGTLLPPDERKRIIAELEALRAKQGGSAAGTGNAPALTNQAASHGDDALRQIEKCSQAGAADLYPECAPED